MSSASCIGDGGGLGFKFWQGRVNFHHEFVLLVMLGQKGLKMTLKTKKMGTTT